jgi:hypothetical protein
MLFLASDLWGRPGVLPVLDPGVLASSEGELAAVGLAVAPPGAAVRRSPGGSSPGIVPFDVTWQAASAVRPIVTVRTSSALVPRASRRRDGRSGEPGLCERANRYGGSGTGESIR